MTARYSWKASLVSSRVRDMSRIAIQMKSIVQNIDKYFIIPIIVSYFEIFFHMTTSIAFAVVFYGLSHLLFIGIIVIVL